MIKKAKIILFTTVFLIILINIYIFNNSQPTEVIPEITETNSDLQANQQSQEDEDNRGDEDSDEDYFKPNEALLGKTNLTSEELKKIHTIVQNKIEESPEEVVKVLIKSEDYKLEDETRIKSKVEKADGEIKLKTKNYIAVEVPADKLKEIVSDDSVEKIYPDKIYYSTLDTSVGMINAPSFWNQGYKGRGIKIAVLDTGIDSTHSMLMGKIIAEKAFTGEDHTYDVRGHGTHVSGIAAGKDNGDGYNGVAPEALLINAKVLKDEDGSGFTSQIIAAMEWAADPDGNPLTDDGADIISMSIGGAYNDPDTPYIEAIRDAVRKGVVVVASSGNCGEGCPSDNCNGYIGVTAPGNVKEAITIGSVGKDYAAACSSSGEDIPGVGIKPDVVAPGTNIISSIPGGYSVKSGTSMAAPHVSGAIALLLEKYPDYTPLQIKQALESTATDLGSPGKDTRYGSGLINLANLLNFDINSIVEYDVYFKKTINKNEVLQINVTQIDDTPINSVAAQINYPDLDSDSLILTKIQNKLYSVDFADTGKEGQYHLDIIVNYGDNYTSSYSGAFNVVSQTLDMGRIKQLEHQNHVNKGENLNLDVLFENTYDIILNVFIEAQLSRQGEIVNNYKTDSVELGPVNYTWIEDDTEDNWFYENMTSGYISEPKNAVDEDWATSASGSNGEGCGLFGYIYENYNIPANAAGANWTIKHGAFGDFTGAIPDSIIESLDVLQLRTRLDWLGGGCYTIMVIKSGYENCTTNYWGGSEWVQLDCQKDISYTGVYNQEYTEGKVLWKTKADNNLSEHQFNINWPINVNPGNYSLNTIAFYSSRDAAGYDIKTTNLLVKDNLIPVLNNVSFSDTINQDNAFVLELELDDDDDLSGQLSVKNPEDSIKEIGIIQSNSEPEKILTAAFTETSLLGTYQFNFTVCDNSNNCIESENYNFEVTDCLKDKKILLVKEIEESPFTEFLSGYCVSEWDNINNPLLSIEYLNKFDAVIWNSGNNLANIDDIEADLLIDYINQNGKLLVEGADIAFNHQYDDFMKNVTHSMLVEDIIFALSNKETTQNKSIIITYLHPITKGLGESILFSSQESPYPDSLEPFNNGHELAAWENGGSSLIIYNGINEGSGKAKTLFLPFSITALDDTTKEKLIGNSVSWLTSDENLAELSVTGITNDYLIPGNNQFDVEIINNGESADNFSLAIYIDEITAVNQLISLASGETNIFTVELSIPYNHHTIKAIVNEDFSIDETTYLNNIFTKEIYVSSIEADLIPRNIAFENNTISADIENIGGSDAVNALVDFFVNEQKIGTNSLNIGYGGIETTSMQYLVEQGIHEIKVEVNPDNSIYESDYSNNILFNELYICSKESALIVEDSDTESYSTENPSSAYIFMDILKKNGFCAEIWNESSQGTPSIDYLNKFDFLIWSAGDYWNFVIDDSDMALLQQYHGNIIFEGSDIAFDHVNDSFIRETLHSELGKDLISSNETGLELTNHDIFKNISEIYLDYSIDSYPDSLKPTDGLSLASWNNADSAIIGYNKTNKMVYFGFSFNILSDEEVKEKLLINIISWFTECVDNDKDGYGLGDTCLGLDCDDSSFEINPISQEVCNGVDDNCNGVIDEGGDSLCDNGLYCDGQETCGNAACLAGTPPEIDDNLFCTEDSCDENNDELLHKPVNATDEASCTIDSCDEENDVLIHSPDNAFCDDGLFCNGQETCNIVNDCQSETPIDCSLNLPIRICVNIPDSNPYTLDYYVGSCDEELDQCAADLINECSIDDCDAECEVNEDCPDTECDHLDGCQANDYYDYDDVANNCDGCGCEDNACAPKPYYNDSRCSECQADDDCNYLDSDYCDEEEIIWRDEGKCVDSFCQREAIEIEACNDYDGEYCDGTEIKKDNYMCSNASCVLSSTKVLENCDDGLFCNGQETCENTTTTCLAETPIDCSIGLPIGICANIPDSNPYTLDYSAGSVCNEDIDSCVDTLTHECSIDDCDAECEVNEDCSDTECDHLDGCQANDYYDYDDVANNCDECSCENNACSATIYNSDLKCSECQADDECLRSQICYKGTCIIGSHSEFEPDENTVALWHLNGDGTDSSGNNYDLSINSNKIKWVNGRFGQAILMDVREQWSSCFQSDGAAATAPGSGLTYPGSGDWTIEAYIKFESLEENYIIMSHYSKHIAGHDPYLFYVNKGNLSFHINNAITVSGDISSYANRWIYATAIYNYKENIQVYINGNLIAETPTALVLEYLPNYNAFVGGNFCGTTKGITIDELRVSNIARPQYFNNAPFIDPVEDLTAREDELFEKTIAAADVDGDSLIFSDNTGLFDINEEGLIRFTPRSDDVGIHNITITVSDGSLTYEITFILTILAKEIVNTAPVIEAFDPAESPTITELEEQTFTITAADAESMPGIIWKLDGVLVGAGKSYTFVGDNSMENSNAGVYEVKVIVSDGQLSAEKKWTLTVLRAKDTDGDDILDEEDNCIFVVNEDQADSDNNGLGNACQGNIDGDNIPDSDDFVAGNINNIDSNLNLNIYIDGDDNLNKVISGTQPVVFKESSTSQPIVNFDYDFNSESSLDLSKIEIKKQPKTSTLGEVIVKGIDLTSKGKTKTIYVDKIAGTDLICIKDAEISSIKEITSSCTGENERLIECDGVSYNSYACTIEADKYKVEGLIHSGLAETNYVDTDGDGYNSNIDCNDNNAAVNPGADEICNNINDDCDNNVDENLKRSATCGAGACAGNTGQETCTNGAWGQNTCSPFAGASNESCDNIDNDCDGYIDENLSRAYSNQKGLCNGNTELCETGEWINGPNFYASVSEKCSDSKDNDCDGSVDEDCTSPSGGGSGGGGFIVTNCNDGLDNDGDGRIDGDFQNNPNHDPDCHRSSSENGPNECFDLGKESEFETSDGECIPGIRFCDYDGFYIIRKEPIGPSEEFCDGLDNDCNAVIDNECVCAEGTLRIFYPDFDKDGFGSSTSSIEECVMPEDYTSDNHDCNDNNKDLNPKAEEKCDNIDNDCDNSIDEGLLKNDSNQNGLCSGNTLLCGSGKWVYSAVYYTPQNELCDEQDNNCDGSIDEDFNKGSICYNGNGECRRSGKYICSEDGVNTICDTAPGQPSDEICGDNKDNDCDGDSSTSENDCAIKICYSLCQDGKGKSGRQTLLSGNQWSECNAPSGCARCNQFYHLAGEVCLADSPGDECEIADLDENKKVDIFDLIELLKILKDNDHGADINLDTKTNIFDLLELLRILKSGNCGPTSLAVACASTCENGKGKIGTTTFLTSSLEWSACDVNGCSSCNKGYHKEGNSCVSNTKSCSVSNGKGEQTWNNKWSSCTIASCNNNYHEEENSCLSNTKSCSVSNGKGEQTWNNKWSSCSVVSCDSEYHQEGDICTSSTRACKSSCSNGKVKTGTQTMLSSGEWGECGVSGCESCNSGYHLEGSACLANADPATCKKADLDSNGKVEIYDYVEIINIIKSKSGSADVNSDGKTDIFDSLKILELIKSCVDG